MQSSKYFWKKKLINYTTICNKKIAYIDINLSNIPFDFDVNLQIVCIYGEKKSTICFPYT